MLVTKGLRLVDLLDCCVWKKTVVDEECAGGSFIERMAFTLERAFST